MGEKRGRKGKGRWKEVRDGERCMKVEGGKKPKKNKKNLKSRR